MFPASLARPGPKHSTSVPSSVEVPIPLSVDVKDVAPDVPNPLPVVSVKSVEDPHKEETPPVLCGRIHSLLAPTLQMVNPFMSPVTLQVKVKVLSGQVGGAGVNCPVTSPGVEMYQQCTKVYVSEWDTILFTPLSMLVKNYV